VPSRAGFSLKAGGQSRDLPAGNTRSWASPTFQLTEEVIGDLERFGLILCCPAPESHDFLLELRFTLLCRAAALNVALYNTFEFLDAQTRGSLLVVRHFWRRRCSTVVAPHRGVRIRVERQSSNGNLSQNDF